jgi:transposase
MKPSADFSYVSGSDLPTDIPSRRTCSTVVSLPTDVSHAPVARMSTPLKCCVVFVVLTVCSNVVDSPTPDTQAQPPPRHWTKHSVVSGCREGQKEDEANHAGRTMRKAAAASTAPVLLPYATESVYVGIDVGKQRHLAGFVSTGLLARHGRFEGCPVFAFDNSREGFRQLIDRIQALCPLEQAYVMLEKTGHYHLALVEYLLEQDLSVYLVHVHARPRGLTKTDKRDALNLANHLYNQLDRGIQFADRSELARRALPPTTAAAHLKGLMSHRYELVHECTQRKNQLTALCDQLFPEFVQVFHDPNAPTALRVRERYPTAAAIATAELDEVCDVKGPSRHSRPDMAHLQVLAAQSIGTRDPRRLESQVFEQEQLIHELQMLVRHRDAIDVKVAQVVEEAREGQILRSIPGIGVHAAAAILAAIGNIDNFPTAAALKAYFGWAPEVRQSGQSVDSTKITRSGERTMKAMMYLVAMNAVGQPGPWADLYHRLVERTCSYDERRRDFRGKKRVLGRIAGQLIALIYGLLRADVELRARTPVREPLPEPLLYDPAVHHAHQTGGYQSMKQQTRPLRLVQVLPQRPDPGRE